MSRSLINCRRCRQPLATIKPSRHVATKPGVIVSIRPDRVALICPVCKAELEWEDRHKPNAA